MFRSSISFIKRISQGHAPAPLKPLGRFSRVNEKQLVRRVDQNNEDHCGSCDWESIILKEAEASWLAYNQRFLKAPKQDKAKKVK